MPVELVVYRKLADGPRISLPLGGFYRSQQERVAKGVARAPEGVDYWPVGKGLESVAGSEVSQADILWVFLIPKGEKSIKKRSGDLCVVLSERVLPSVLGLVGGHNARW